jgi:hypothetical protein
MMFPFCPQEEKIAAMLKENRRLQDADPALLDHARICSRCSEILFAVEMLQGSRASAMMSAHIASPGCLWWRAQLRRQSGVAEQMTRPIVWAERLALICILCVFAGFGFWQRAQLLDLFSSFVGLSLLAGVTAILCVGGLTLFLSDRKP